MPDKETPDEICNRLYLSTTKEVINMLINGTEKIKNIVIKLGFVLLIDNIAITYLLIRILN